MIGGEKLTNVPKAAFEEFQNIVSQFSVDRDIKKFVYSLLDNRDLGVAFDYFKDEFIPQFFKGNLKGYIKAFEPVFDKEFFKLNVLAQKAIVMLFFYAYFNENTRSKEDALFFEFLYKLFIKAKDSNNLELMAYLYIPMVFSCQDNKVFNGKVNKTLERVILKNFKSDFKPKPKPSGKTKIGFMIERAIWHSVNQVNYSFLVYLKEDLEEENRDDIEVMILDLNYFELAGGLESVKNKFRSIGFKYVDLHTALNIPKTPLYNIVEKSVKVRDYIRDLELDVLIISPITHFTQIFLLNTRVAKKQVYWSHGNCFLDVKGIDKRISHFEQPCSEFSWKIFHMSVVKELLLGTEKDKEEGKRIKEELLNEYGKDTVTLGTIGRLTKVDSDEYLQVVSEIMKKNPNTIYLACGSGDIKPIKEKLRKYGIDENRFIFTGYINPHAYGWVIDIMLDTFPEPQGQSMAEFTAKGGECVILEKSLKEKGKNPILEYINSATQKITWIRVRRKYKKVEFTKEDFWNFSLLKDHSELFLSYDNIMEEKNVELLREILERFENIKILVDEKDYDKLAFDQKYKERLIVENDIFERAYKSDFFMLFENKQEIFEFVRDYTTARYFNVEFAIDIPLWKRGYENFKNNISGIIKTFKKILTSVPDDFMECWWVLLKECFDNYEEYKRFILIDALGNSLVIKRLLFEACNNRLLARLKITQRISRVEPKKRIERKFKPSIQKNKKILEIVYA